MFTTKRLGYKTLLTLTTEKERLRLRALTFLRASAAILDILGLIGVALLTTAAFEISSSGGRESKIEVPFFGSVNFDETVLFLVGLTVLLTFVIKSILSVAHSFITARFIAGVETRVAMEAIEGVFFSVSNHKLSESRVRNLALQTSTGVSEFLNGRVQVLSELWLGLAIISSFIVVNPMASLMLLIYVGGILFILNRMLAARIRATTAAQMRASENTFETLQNLFDLRPELVLSSKSGPWIHDLKLRREAFATSTGKLTAMTQIPRHLLETSLIAGVFLMFGLSILLSDIESQVVTLGVLLAGGLRITASAIPLQNALNAIDLGLRKLDDLHKVRKDTRQSNGSEVLNHTGSNIRIREPQPAITCKNVSFTHQNDAKPVLRDVNFRIEHGQHVGIVGKSGAGKSTLVNLLCGLSSPDSGLIKIHGVNAVEVSHLYPSTLSLVSQSTNVIAGTLIENVSLIPQDRENLDKVKKCLQAAGLSSFTESPDWSKKMIHPDTAQLSGGEMQRLSLARALFQDSPIILLDEPTSALDQATEDEILATLEKLKGRKTVLIVAHRSHSLRHCDMILSVNQGRVTTESSSTDSS